MFLIESRRCYFLAAAYFRLNGRFPYNKKEVDENLKILTLLVKF